MYYQIVKYQRFNTVLDFILSRGKLWFTNCCALYDNFVIMLRFRVCFTLFWWLTTIKSDILPELNKQIQNNIEVNSSPTDGNIHNVTFKDSKQTVISAIYLPRNADDSIDGVYAFHSALNCKFAEWAMEKIYDFVKRTPLFYQKKFSKVENVNFRTSLDALISVLDAHVWRFINILNNFLDTNSNILYYFDTSVLESLVSIQIKIDYLNETGKPDDDTDSRYLYNVTRWFVKELTTLQSFLSVNCKDNMSINRNNSQLHGYWISVDDVEGEKMDVDVFLSSVIKLESNNHSTCKPTSMFLEMFVTLIDSPELQVSINVEKSCVLTDRFYVLSIKDLTELIKITYDTELIYFYQNFVLTSSMVYVFNKIRFILIFRELPIDPLQEQIKTIHAKISEDRSNFPALLADGFTVLANCLKKTLPEQQLDVLMFLKRLENKKYASIFVEKQNSMVVDKLTAIMTSILENIENLKCFQQYHKSLHVKYEKIYIIPLVKEENSLSLGRFNIAVLENKHNEQVCAFLLSMYSMCYEALMLFQDSFYGSKIFMGKSMDIFEKLQRYLFIIIRAPSYDVHLLKMALKITPVIVDMMEKFKNGLDVSVVKRIANVIMNELNISGIKYCSSSQNNFLLFNNINFLEFGNVDLIEKSIEKFIHNVYPSFIRADLTTSCKYFDEYKYFVLTLVFDELVKSTDFYEKYKNHILVVWKGQQKNLYEIYNDMTIIVLNPYTLYSFYDIIYKFYIAVFYDVVLTTLEQKRFYKSEKKFKKITDALNDLDSDIFPLKLRPLISDIKRLYSADSGMSTLEASKQSIFETFEKFNFVFKEMQTKLGKMNTYVKSLFCITSSKHLDTIYEITNSKLTFYNSFQRNVLNKYDFSVNRRQ